jgi:23S rRNA pseudouridine2604 synthase
VNIRLNKYISDAGLCSRREADRKIEQGKVRVNGKVACLGDLVNDDDVVLVDGNPVRTRLQRVYLAYNKPVGITSTTERTDPDNIVKAVGYHGGRVFPVGRLDKDSQGLILLTNDGDIVNKILRVSNAHEKEYIVSVDRPVTDEFVQRMSAGVNILGVTTRSCEVERLDRQVFRIVLKQGLNRQIRRMCKALGYKVLKLERVRIMHIGIRGIGSGSWRFLTDDEIDVLMQAVGHSTSDPLNAPVRKRNSPRKPGFVSGKYESGNRLSGKSWKNSDAGAGEGARSGGTAKAAPKISRGPDSKSVAGKSAGKVTDVAGRTAGPKSYAGKSTGRAADASGRRPAGKSGGGGTSGGKTVRGRAMGNSRPPTKSKAGTKR